MAYQALNLTALVPCLPWIGIAYIIKDAQSSLFQVPYKLLAAAVYLPLYTIAAFRQSQVTNIIPEPYLDEVFYIPLVQAYCVGDFYICDLKFSTLIGPYAFTTIFGNLNGSCDVFTLRSFNALVLIFTMSYAASCYGLINRFSSASPFGISLTTLHTAFNIALFPPLFFFSGLFYIDILSVCLVLRIYKFFLQSERGVWLYITSILTLTTRQTNIFWVTIYIGGLEVVRTLKEIPQYPYQALSEPKTWKEHTVSTFSRYTRGQIHDIPLKEAYVIDLILCGISMAIATLYHPIIILSKL